MTYGDNLNSTIFNMGFEFLKTEICDTYFVSKENKDLIILHDFLNYRFGLYYKRNLMEQFYIMGTTEKKSFLDWLKNPVRKTSIEIAASKMQEYIKEKAESFLI